MNQGLPSRRDRHSGLLRVPQSVRRRNRCCRRWRRNSTPRRRDISLTMTATALAIAISAPFAGAIADVLGRKRVIVAAMMLLDDSDRHDRARAEPARADRLALRARPRASADLHRRGRLYRRGMAARARRPASWASTWRRPASADFAAASSPACSPTRSAGATASSNSPAMTLACGLAVAAILPRERNFVALRRACRLGAADARPPAQSAAACDLCGRLRHAVQFRRAVHLCELRAGGAAVQSVADAARRDLRHLSRRRCRGARGSGARSRASGGARWSSARSGCGSCGALLTLVPSLPVIVVGLAVAAACGFITQATSTGYVALTAESGRTSAIGLYAACFYVGGSVGAILPGLTWNTGGWPACVAMVVAMQV